MREIGNRALSWLTNMQGVKMETFRSKKILPVVITKGRIILMFLFA